MGFKTVTQFNKERYDGFFLLKNDGDFKDVILLYRNVDDVLIADTHYIKSPEYSGYCHCLGRGCPACAKDIRVQPKLFIPLYDIESDQILFWDRGARFENTIVPIFEQYPNPSEYVFRITRNGEAGSVDTKYSIVAKYKNTYKSYATILSEAGVTLPEYYNTVCKELSDWAMHSMLNSGKENSTENSLEDYQAIPRSSVNVKPPTDYQPEPGVFESSPIPDAPVDDEDGEDGPDF